MKTDRNIDHEGDEDLKMSSTLRSIRSGKDPYQVPEGYFMKMEDQVMARIRARDEGIWLRVVRSFKRPAISIPLGLALAAIALLLLFKKPVEERNMTMPQLSQEELMQSDIFMDMDESLLMESFYASGTNQSATLSEDEQFKKEAEQYLIDHKIDVNLIMNEL